MVQLLVIQVLPDPYAYYMKGVARRTTFIYFINELTNLEWVWSGWYTELNDQSYGDSLSPRTGIAVFLLEVGVVESW